MSGFIGRQGELAGLGTAIEALAAGVGGIVLLSGEAGIGKTRLCEEVADRARARGVQVAWARCWEAAAVPAFWPWQQLLRQLTSEDLPGSGAGATGATGAGEDADLARLAFFDAVVAQVGAAASVGPVLLVVDDLQWADLASVRLLTYLTSARPVPALIVATYREPLPSPVTPVADAILGLARLGRQVRLGGLPAADLGELARTITAVEQTVDATALHRLTAGNPLFAQELVRLLDAHGSLGRLGTEQLPPVPATVRAVLARRLHELSPDCRTVLETGALVGDEFRVDVLEEVTELPRPRLLELLAEGLAAQLLREVGIGAYAFSHPLVRAALYEDLGVARRVRLHQRAAAVLERRRAGGHEVDLAALAHHFVQAAPAGSAAKAAAYAVEAAGWAMSRFAYESAVGLYEQALSALELDPSAAPATDRGSVLVDLGAALVASGNLAAARSSYLKAAELARRAGRADQLAEAALGVGSGGGFEVGLADREQVDLLEEARDQLRPSGPSALLARVTARLSVALSLSGAESRRLALADEAVAMARAVDDGAALAYALSAHCDAIAGPADTAARMHESAEIIELARTIGDRGTELLGRRLRVVALLEAGDTAGFEAEIEAYARLADLIRQPLYGWYVPLWRATRALMRGELARCEELGYEAQALGAQAQSANAEILVESQRWYAHREAGDVDSTAALDRVLPYETTFGAQIRVVVTLVVADAGRLDEARARLDADAAAIRALPCDSEWVSTVVQLSQIIALVGAHPLAEWAYDALLPVRHVYAVDGIGAAWSGSVERSLGLLAAALGRPADAVAHFDAAVAANRAAGSPLFVARALRDWGITLDDRGRLDDALAAYRELGLTWPVADLERRLAEDPPAAANLFRRDGDVWELGYAGKLVWLKDVKGLRDLAVLLAQSGREVAASDLISPGAPVSGDVGEALDERARKAYRARLDELEAEMERADLAGDVSRSARVEEERKALVAQLAGAYGLGGRPRRIGDDEERARQAVSWRIRDALARIERVHPELAGHLRGRVRTGAFCVYDPADPVSWSL